MPTASALADAAAPTTESGLWGLVAAEVLMRRTFGEARVCAFLLFRRPLLLSASMFFCTWRPTYPMLFECLTYSPSMYASVPVQKNEADSSLLIWHSIFGTCEEIVARKRLKWPGLTDKVAAPQGPRSASSAPRGWSDDGCLEVVNLRSHGRVTDSPLLCT
eukprot:SAG11_NODE_9718_length_886_cov_1.421855_2_plen_160_part_01